jgi:hypothetical protein
MDTGLIVTGALLLVLACGLALARWLDARARAHRGFLPTGETDFDRAAQRARTREDLGRLQ